MGQERSTRPVGVQDRNERYRMWKEEHVPLLYDWATARTFSWPHAAVCWGTKKDQSSDTGARNRGNGVPARYTTRGIYIAERTGMDTPEPNTLLHFDVRIVDEHFTQLNSVAKNWFVESTSNAKDKMSTAEFWLRKRIVHPGEVNKIRLLAPGIVATCSDSPDLFVWDMEKQPHRREDEANTKESKPDVTLQGHTDASEFALAVWNGSGGPHQRAEYVHIASGGKDGTILVWRMQDTASVGNKLKQSVVLGKNGGHGQSGRDKFVEDVSFTSADSNVIVSVGRDKAMCVWDVRSPNKVEVIPDAHESDVNCCDYGGADPNFIATGGSDKKVKVWDRRKLKKSNGEPNAAHVFSGHLAQVNAAVWNRYVPQVLASGGEDGQVLLWDCKKDEGVPLHDPRNHHNGLIFNHVGHTNCDCTIIDLDWMPSEHDPWCIATLSEKFGDGGSSLQIWRPSNFIYRDKAEVNADLVRYSAAER